MAQHGDTASDETLKAILESRDVYTVFQPVINLSAKTILGFEAQNKGKPGESSQVVRLSELTFEGCVPETRICIDRLCREKALEEFRILHEKQNWLRLFLTVEASVLQFEQADFSYLIKQVEESGLPPESIVVEVSLESVVKHVPVEIDVLYREMGFKTCVRDVETHHPFLDCLLRYEPTYIKIGTSFLPGSSDDTYRIRLLSGLMDYARRTGTTVIGFDVESLEESVRLMQAGVIFQQGGYFGMSKKENADPFKQFFSRMEAVYDQHKVDLRDLRARLKKGFDLRLKLPSSIASRLSGTTPDQYEGTLQTLIAGKTEVVRCSVLNDAGMQITPNVFNPRYLFVDESALEGVLGEGSDHSTEELYLHLDSGIERYVSQSYFSRLASQTCFLVGRTFYSRVGTRYIVVLEMTYPS